MQDLETRLADEKTRSTVSILSDEGKIVVSTDKKNGKFTSCQNVNGFQ